MSRPSQGSWRERRGSSVRHGARLCAVEATDGKARRARCPRYRVAQDNRQATRTVTRSRLSPSRRDVAPETGRRGLTTETDGAVPIVDDISASLSPYIN